LTAFLVPTCGKLLGGALHSFGGANLVEQNDNFNAGLGVKMVVAHDYRTPGQVMSPSDVTMAQRTGTLLDMNWKPAQTWASADGSDAGVNAGIDAMAKSIKALGNRKIMVTLFHEPENDVSGGAAGCPASVYKGHAGTPDQYRAMWANTENRFNALGVTNVVWVMNYMGFGGWDCMVNDMWPGNSLVDWVLWDPYGHPGSTFTQSAGSFYNVLTKLTDPTHNYLSKPWGLGEFGIAAQNNADRVSYYTSMKAAFDNNTFPNLKMLEVWDTTEGHGLDFRVAYDYNDQANPQELAAFKAVANDPAIADGRASVAGH
jgi:hypothetical protein